MSELLDLTILEAAQLLRSKQISAVELTEAYLERIQRLDKSLNAFITVTGDSARDQARHADQELAGGLDRGPLHGIPVALKDLFETRGIRTTGGSKFLGDYRPERDATVVTKLAEAGAVQLGKLNMHEFAYGTTNENPHFGNAQNPWHIGYVTGGSSGGSAAAIAARLALGTLGSDTGGSIRIPAALCGVTGLKPTFGRTSLAGVLPLSWSNDHAGPLARDAADALAVLAAISGFDPADPNSIDRSADELVRRPIGRIRVSAPGGYFAEHVNGEVLEAVQAAAQELQSDGAIPVKREPPRIVEMFEANRTILRVEALAYHQRRISERPEDFGPDVLRRLRAGESVSAIEYALARRKQAELRRELEDFFQHVDILVTPTTRVPAFQAGSLDPVQSAQDLTAFTAPFDVTGVPAISVPCGFTRDGLPIGLQLVARPWAEALLVEVAARYQSRTDWHKRKPPL